MNAREHKIRIPKKRISRRRPKGNTRFSIPSQNNIRLVLPEREIEQTTAGNVRQPTNIAPPGNVRPPLSETQRRNRPLTDLSLIHI